MFKIKRIFLLTSLLISFSSIGFSQSSTYAKRIWPVTALPATCNPLNGEVVTLTVAPGTGVYNCTGVNTWMPIGGSGASGQWLINQGTITGSFPFINHAVVWNNAGVTFFNMYSNVTDTASMPGSQLFSWAVNGTEVFGVTKLGRLYITQPTLTASIPFISHTATWNAGGVTFVDDFRNITDTASGAASMFLRFQVMGADRLRLDKNGNLNVAGGITIGATEVLIYTGQTKISSIADGRINFTNNAVSDFNRLSLGPETVVFPSIAVSPAVAGQTQGIIIGKGDGTFATFANLGAATNGSMIYCSDCQAIAVCAAAGTGAIAKRLNGAWVCN
jgi:hypothetical protein